MSRPVGIKTTKKRAKTVRIYHLGVSVEVQEGSRLHQKDVHKRVRQLLGNGLIRFYRAQQDDETAIVRVTRNINETIARIHERYRQRLIAEAPRNPKVNPGGR